MLKHKVVSLVAVAVTVMAVTAPSALGVSIFFEDFEGPTGALNTVDPAWSAGDPNFGFTGGLNVVAGVGTGGSNGAQKPAGTGFYGADHATPTLTTGVVTLEGDISFAVPIETLASIGANGGALLWQTAPAVTFAPGINFEISGLLGGGPANVNLQASSLGGLPGNISMGQITGDSFHMKLTVDLDNKTLQADLTGDAVLSSGLLAYTGAFAPDLIGIVGAREGNAGTTWDNINVDNGVIPEPASMALLALGGLLTLRRRR